MAECQWLKPALVGQFEFLKWTADDHLRHSKFGTYNVDPRSANLNSELIFVCRGQRDLAAEVLASIAAREAASGMVIERGKIVQRSALLGATPLAHRLRFLLEMPVANLFNFLL